MKKNKKKGSTSKKSKQESAETPAPETTEGSGEPAPASDDKAVEDAPETPQDEEPAEERAKEDSEDASPSSTPSLAQQSKLRSTSFRAGTSGDVLPPGPFSPEGDTAPEIYRKHVARIEELEKENKQLAKEAADSEKRWKKAEEELADIRDSEGDEGSVKRGGGDEVDKLVSLVVCSPNSQTR